MIEALKKLGNILYKETLNISKSIKKGSININLNF